MIRDRILARQSERSRRSSSRGFVDINQVDQALLREDLGFKLTQSAYDEYMGNRSQFLTNYENVIDSNKAAISQNTALLNQAKDYIGEYEGMMGKSYEDLSAGMDMVPVYLTYGSQKEWFLPREVAAELVAKTSEGSNLRGLKANWIEVKPWEAKKRSQLYTNPNVYSGVNQEHFGIDDPERQNVLVISPYQRSSTVYYNDSIRAIDQTVNNVQKDIMDQYLTNMEEAKPKYEQALQLKSDAGNAIAESEANMLQAQQSRDIMNTEEESRRKQYQSSIAQRTALFGG